jgi:hypothetical protein
MLVNPWRDRKFNEMPIWQSAGNYSNMYRAHGDQLRDLHFFSTYAMI